MAEDLIIDEGIGKAERYEQLIPQIKALTEGEPDKVANFSNVMAALKYGMGFFWVGVYFVGQDELVLGPFQGPVACTRIQHGKGVCGTCWSENTAQLVPDVEAFPGHIACSSDSKSEIVIPGRNKQGQVTFVLDVDSDQLNDFDTTDQHYLELVVAHLQDLLDD